MNTAGRKPPGERIEHSARLGPSRWTPNRAQRPCTCQHWLAQHFDRQVWVHPRPWPLPRFETENSSSQQAVNHRRRRAASFVSFRIRNVCRPTAPSTAVATGHHARRARWPSRGVAPVSAFRLVRLVLRRTHHHLSALPAERDFVVIFN